MLSLETERIQEPESRIQKSFGILTTLILASGFWLLDSPRTHADQFVDSTWAQVSRYLAVHPGTTEAVWEDAAKSLVTNGLMQMTPVGDGTYRTVLQLTPGATYNFLFFAKTGASPPTGLQPNFTYYDAVPTGGNIQSGTEPLKVTKYDTSVLAPARYGGIGTNSDARRVLAVPSNLTQNDTFYVYGNFADRPISVKNFDVIPVDTTSVRLTWEGPYGIWGQGSENMKAVDVVAGGTMTIYRNTTGSTTTFSFVKQLKGSDTSYYDTSLTAGTTYYYVLTANDAYRGKDLDTVFARLYSETTPLDTGTPNNPVRIRFKVHHLDWNYVNQHGGVVYMTDEREEDVFFARRVMGVIRRVDL